ncbi:hypothetical protein ABIB62_002677 [Mucilaginibacter sp. UYP25]|uniref:hypothetical protein n=1 Tax=unclassified Mucilaginibacter TaxID=2617802 RepID=UPI003394638E
MAKPKTYNVIIKLAPAATRDAEQWTKFHGLVAPASFRRLYVWLDKNHPKWCYGNVFYYRKQVGSFKKTDRPTSF